MYLNNRSPLTTPITKTPRLTDPEILGIIQESKSILPREEYESILQEHKLEEPESAAQKVRDIMMSHKGKETRPVFEKIMKMRGEMIEADVKEKSIKEENKLIYKELEDVSKGKFSGLLYNSFTDKFYEEDPILSKFVFDALTEGMGHSSNERETMDFTKEIYKKLASNYGKKEIKLDGEPAFSFDRFGLKPDETLDEEPYETEYKKDKEGNSYAHLTKTESKTYTIFGKKPYKLVETTEYSWDVDTYTDEYGDEVADDEDIGYENADVKISYKLVRK